jgi:XTP/dITP diphosphohydrolase
MKLVFATNNKHKFYEIEHKVGDIIHLINLNDLGFNEEIPESHMTLEENAAEKAFFIYQRFQLNCFADDTGLEIEALSGKPGVFSARYAGSESCSEKNIIKVLNELQGVRNREAQFRTVIALVENGKLISFEGSIRGEIIENQRGMLGFGYDPIFRPVGFSQTFAEMSIEEKNKISHRTIAVNKLVDYLLNKYKN